MLTRFTLSSPLLSCFHSNRNVATAAVAVSSSMTYLNRLSSTVTSSPSSSSAKEQEEEGAASPNSSSHPPRASIMSPADVARRVARGGGGAGAESGGGPPTTATPRPSKVRGGVVREAILLYRSLLKETGKRGDLSVWNHNNDIANTLQQQQQQQPIKENEDSNTKLSNSWLKRPMFVLNGEQKYVRDSFRKNQSIPRSKVEQIQWHLHYGHSKLDELKEGSGNRTGFSVLTFN